MTRDGRDYEERPQAERNLTVSRQELIMYRYFAHQFVLCRDAKFAPTGWNVATIQDWDLATHSSLPVHDLQTRDGRLIGWILGWLVLPSADLAEGAIKFPHESQCDLDVNAFESWLYGFSGRWACAIITDKHKRLYLDPLGSLAAVYSARDATAASTVTLIRPPEKTLGEFPDNKPNQFYPAGLTASPGVHRLLPNHFLDLTSFGTARHWPMREDLLTPAHANGRHKSDEEIATAIAEALKKNVSAVTKKFHCYTGLTSGRDSRMLLACARNGSSEMTFVTFDYQNRTRANHVDLYMAQRLAKYSGLRHRILPISDAASTERAHYLQRIGFAGGSGKVKDFHNACSDHLDLTGGWLHGFGGEVGRAFYWRKNGQEGEFLAAGELLTRMNLPATPEFLSAVTDWLEQLPAGIDVYSVLDLAYLEHRVGSWASPHLYGGAPFAVSIIPFCDRRIISGFLRLSVENRQQRRVARQVISASWRELAGFPFGDYTGARRSLQGIRWKGEYIIRQLRLATGWARK